MKKPDPIEAALDHFSSLRDEPNQEVVVTGLRKALKDRSNLVVAKAAKLAGELRISAIVPDLVSTFERLMKNPAKLDKRCEATFAIATALHALDYTEPDVYLAGVRHIQLEASFGPPVDEAAKLRAQCALGLVRTRHPQALIAVSELLADRWAHARLGAIRALASNGGEGGVMLLRYKALMGDKDAEVFAECLSGLLAADFANSLAFVARIMDADGPDTAESAVLAIASQRRTEAFEALREKWERSVNLDIRKTLLTAMATMRIEEATEFLIGLLHSATTSTGVEIIRVLAAYQKDERIKARLQDALRTIDNRQLSDAFRAEW